MKWLRLYSEVRTDKKLATLTLAERGVWTNLLCYAADQEERGTFDASDRFLLALECSEGDEDILDSTLTKLLKVKHIIPLPDGRMSFRTFKERQYDKPSDAPERVAERVAQYRQRQAEQRNTSREHVTPRNAPVTPRNTLYAEGEAEAEAERDSTPKSESEPKAAAEGDASPAFETRDTATHGASAPASDACDDASFIHLCAEVAQAAHLTAAPEKIAHLLKQHPTLAHARLIFEAEMAAEWIADPSRNKKKRTMSVSFLNNWLSKASEPPHLRVVNGHNGNTGAAANGPSPMSRASPAEPERVFRDARTLKITPRPASLDNLPPPPPPKQTQNRA